MHLQGLLIDVDDVLYDSTFWDRWLHKLLARFGVVGPYVCHEKTWHIDHLPAVNRGEIDYWSALKKYLISLGLTRGQTEEVIAASRMRHHRFLQSKRVFPANRVCLSNVASVLPVTLVSNSFESGTQIADYMRQSGVSHRTLEYLTSRDVGRVMPQQEFFDAAITKQGFAKVAFSNIGLVSSNALTVREATRLGLITFSVGLEREVPSDWKYERFDQVASHILRESIQRRMVA